MIEWRSVDIPTCSAPISDEAVAMVAESYRRSGWLRRKLIMLRLMCGAMSKIMCPACYIRCMKAIGQVKLTEQSK